MKTLVIIVFVLIQISSFGQSKNEVCFKTILTSNDTIENFKFYIGFSADRENVSKYYLIDVLHGDSKVSVPKSQLKYLFIGTDSLSNVAGAFDGALDPIHGMYWAWNTGFINLKLEGKRSSGQDFSWHLGGYTSPTNCSAWIALPEHWTSKKKNTIQIDLSAFLSKTLDLDQSIMHPSSEARQIFDLFISSVHVD